MVSHVKNSIAIPGSSEIPISIDVAQPASYLGVEQARSHSLSSIVQLDPMGA
jgi:hypothetical protein